MVQRRLVYYSLCFAPDAPRPDLLEQLEASLASLRRHNRTIPVVVFTYGTLPAGFERIVGRHGTTVCARGAYEAALASRLPDAAPALARYPLLHKFLNFDAIDRLGPEAVLFLDCDTLFSGDVEALFERYAAADCCAREEPTCSRSHYGYDPGYVDEALLGDLAAQLGLGIPQPFNLGIVLWNRQAWRRAPRLDHFVVGYAWRFLLSLALRPPPATSPYGRSEAAEFVAARSASISAADRQGALPYPSANPWILDQVALWFALGHLPGLSMADFDRHDVLQNGEFLEADPLRPAWTACHYYSQNTDRIARWLGARGLPSVGDVRTACC